MPHDDNPTDNRDICRIDDRVCEEREISRSRINISACLEARSLYDAAYHRDRDCVVVPPPKPQVVSLWDYLRAGGMKAGALALGRSLQLTMLILGAMIVANGVQNAADYERAQPIIHNGVPPVFYWRELSKEGKPHHGVIVDAVGQGTWAEPSAYKLPDDWDTANVSRYTRLLIALFLSGIAGRICLKRSHRIRTGIPIQYADTAHLSAQESLVRASQEPAGASLMRGAARPETSPDTLLRPLGSARETPPEQLVRAVAGQEQG